MINIFRTHEMQTANGRAVRQGNDYRCITGYHQLYPGNGLAGQTSWRRPDIAVSPLDAPDRIPAGCCIRREHPDFTSANQELIWRD